MSESSNTRTLCRALEFQGAMTYPLTGDEWRPKGWPDRYICHESWRGFVESKSITGILSPAQKHVIQRLKARGENVVVCRFSADGKTLMFEDEEGERLSNWIRWGLFFPTLVSIS